MPQSAGKNTVIKDRQNKMTKTKQKKKTNQKK